MAEEIRTEIVADPTKHTAGVNQAKKDAQEFGAQWDKTAQQQQSANNKISKSREGLLREGMGLSRSMGDLAKGSGDLSQNLGNVSFDLSQVGEKMKDMGGKTGALGGSLQGLATKIAGVGIAWQVGTKIGEVANSFEVVREGAESAAGSMVELANWITGGHIDALADAVAGNNRVSKSTEDWTTNLGELDSALAAHAQLLAAVTGQTGETEMGGGTVADRPAAPTSKTGRSADYVGTGEWARDRQQQRTQDEAKAKAAVSRMKAFEEKERQDAMAGADKLTADLLKREDKERAAIANLDKLAADNKKALADMAAAEDTRRREASRAEYERFMEAQKRIDEKRIADTQAAMATFGLSMTSMQLGAQIFGPDFAEKMSAAEIAVTTAITSVQDAGRQLLEANIGLAMEQALGPSVQYVQVQEQLTRSMFKTDAAFKSAQKAQKDAAKAEKARQLSTGEAFKATTRDVLKNVATTAAVESAMALAKAIFPPATTAMYLAQAAAFAGVAALAGGAAAAIGPVTKRVPAASRSSDASETRGGGVGVGAKEGPVTQTVNVTVYTLPGTEANGIYEGIERGMNRARRERGRRELPA
jgi:hypothetical protein